MLHANVKLADSAKLWSLGMKELTLDQILEKLTLPIGEVRHEKISMDSEEAQRLKPHPLNEKIYGENEDIAGLILSLKKGTQIQPLLVNTDGTILSGHLRWKALVDLHQQDLLRFQNKIPQTEIRSATITWIDLAGSEQVKALLLANQSRQKTPYQQLREVSEWEKQLEIEQNWGNRELLNDQICLLVGVSSRRSLDKLRSMVQFLHKLESSGSKRVLEEVQSEIKDCSIDKMDRIRVRFKKYLEWEGKLNKEFFITATKRELEDLCKNKLVEIGYEEFLIASHPLNSFRSAVAKEFDINLESAGSSNFQFKGPLDEGLADTEEGVIELDEADSNNNREDRETEEDETETSAETSHHKQQYSTERRDLFGVEDWIGYAMDEGLNISFETHGAFSNPLFIRHEVEGLLGFEDKIEITAENLLTVPYGDHETLLRLIAPDLKEKIVDYGDLVVEVGRIFGIKKKQIDAIMKDHTLDSFLDEKRNISFGKLQATITKRKGEYSLCIMAGSDTLRLEKITKLLTELSSQKLGVTTKASKKGD
ncbi:MAG: hypothetical protein QNL04_09735 [SAR324 cluster bacterium]|nr:hypothetical protein [SAR324 cluster bacterium]